jgi:spermidine synthase
VIAACRGWFKLPPDDTRLQVRLGDAALAVLDSTLHGTVDALQVDLYDHEAASPVLDSAEFYADCRRLLTEEGAMTVNLFGRSSSYAASVAHMTEAFGEDAVWSFRPTREGNTVVLAQRVASRPERADLLARAADIESRWGLPARKWLRVFHPVVP